MSSEEGWEGAEAYYDQSTQPIDPLLKAKLADFRNRVPRFLFRGLNNTAPDFSGGYEGLNTTSAVATVAYLDNPPSSVVSVFDGGGGA